MFSFKESSNNAKVTQQINNLNALTQRGIRRALYENGKDLADDARKFINTKPKHGKIYKLSHGVKGKELTRLKKHTASAPGEAPAVITGLLRKSINFTVSGVNQLEFGVDMRKRYGGADYGKYLEFADLIFMTGQGSKNIKPRPFISASYKKNKVKMMQRFSNSINQELNK